MLQNCCKMKSGKMLHFRLDVAEWTNINGKNMATFNIYIDKSHTQKEEQKLILQRKEATSLLFIAESK